jgi:hypothetical protein
LPREKLLVDTHTLVEHDGHGRLGFDDRPFVVMKDRAFIDLGSLSGSLLE